MCGIAGLISENATGKDALASMLEKMTFRGPDSKGTYFEAPFFGGMRRLSINDLITGDQPLYNSDKSIVVFYNGEIYNFKEIKKNLEIEGYKFRTQSDGEVICHLYEKHGIDFLKYIRGMFSIALWDHKEQKLILTRDPQGEKPLYYCHQESQFFFSSHLNSFRDLKLKLSLNKQAIWDYLSFLWIPQPQTIYNEVLSLMPGQVLLWKDSKIDIIPGPVSINENFGKKLSDTEASELIREKMEMVVEQQLISDVPVGCFLSAGLDSSIVTTLAARKNPNLHTFTIAFEDVDDPYHGKSNESLEAEAYAHKLKTKHHTIKVTSETFLNNLVSFVRKAGQPFAVSSGLGILSISEKAKELGIKVLLSGDGADELFGGYSWYKDFTEDRSDQELSNDKIDDCPSMQVYPQYRSETATIVKKYPPDVQAWAWHYYASERTKKMFASAEFNRTVEPSIRHFSEVKELWKGPFSFVENDRRFYLVNEMLQKADLMTMANSIEGRLPFLDREIQKVARSLSFDQMVRDGELKWALKNAFADILPEDILRRPKHGFNVPIDYWLKGKWKFLIDETFSVNSCLFKEGLISENALGMAYDLLEDKKSFHGHTIFCYIILNIWLKEVHHGNNC